MADLKRLWKTTDRDKLENLEVVARGLLNDKDRDVSELAFRAITQMDYIRTHINVRLRFIILLKGPECKI